MKTNSYFYIPIKGSKKKFVGGAMAVAGMGLQVYQMIQQQKAAKEAAKKEDAMLQEQERKQQLELDRQQYAIDSEELKRYPTRGYNIEGFYAKGGWIQKATASIKRRGTEGVCTGGKFGSSSCPPGSRRYNLAKTFKKMAKNKALGGVIDTDSKETTIAPNAIQVNTNKKGTDKINAKVAGEDFNLDNNEVVVKDSMGRIVAISDDLGEATRYRRAIAEAGNNPRLHRIINNKFANRAIALERGYSKNKYMGGWMDGEEEYPFRMPRRSEVPPFVKTGLRYRNQVSPSYSAIEDDASPIYQVALEPEKAGKLSPWDSARIYNRINYYGLDGRTPTYKVPSNNKLDFADPKTAIDSVPESYATTFASPLGANNPIAKRGASIFEQYPVGDYDPYRSAEESYSPSTINNQNKTTIPVKTRGVNTNNNSTYTPRTPIYTPYKSYYNRGAAFTTVGRRKDAGIKNIEDTESTRFRSYSPMEVLKNTEPATIGPPEMGDISVNKSVDNTTKYKPSFNDVATGITQLGQAGLSVWNMIANEKARKRLADRKFPDFKYPRYKSMNIDVNRPEYEQTVSDLRADQRSMESMIERGSTSSQDALARIAASRLGTGRNINRAFSSYMTNRGNLYNADVSQRNQFMTNRAAMEMNYDQAKYSDAINRINTGLALTGSSINSIQGFINNLDKRFYQAEELKAIGASLGVKFSGLESYDQMMKMIKDATLTQPLNAGQ